MEVLDLRRFENLIRARSGLNMRPQEAPLLEKTLEARMRVLRYRVPGHYLDFLASDSADAQGEWNQLFVLLTNQESYFFRDQGQLTVVRQQILTELIQRRSSARTLRIWSAGCSTGEEAYTLAMMLDQVLPLREDWRVRILGTDLSAEALEHARRGVYAAWSFRMMDAELQRRFFQAHGNKWEVKPQLRRSVSFVSGNLLLDEFPHATTEMRDMDLIVCRNVFIYFGRDEVAQVLRKFSATLRHDGYLVTGHTELHGVALGDLQVRAFPQTVAYQRREVAGRVGAVAPVPAAFSVASPIAPSVSPPKLVTSISVAPVSRPPFVPNAPDVLVEAADLIQAGGHVAALQILHLLLEKEPRHLAALCLAAQVEANTGRLDEAEASCRRALEVSAFALLPYRLLARIATERGDSEAAKMLLKKVVYLHPASAPDYLELSAIYASEGDATRAAQMRRAAEVVLNGFGDDALLPADEYDIETPVTAGELKRQLQSFL